MLFVMDLHSYKTTCKCSLLLLLNAAYLHPLSPPIFHSLFRGQIFQFVRRIISPSPDLLSSLQDRRSRSLLLSALLKIASKKTTCSVRCSSSYNGIIFPRFLKVDWHLKWMKNGDARMQIRDLNVNGKVSSELNFWVNGGFPFQTDKKTSRAGQTSLIALKNH